MRSIGLGQRFCKWHQAGGRHPCKKGMIAPQRTAKTGASIQMSTMEEAPLAVAWYATLVLAFMYWLSILDRFIISLLVGPIKHDLHITDTQFGLLHGLAFALTFCLFGLVGDPLGYGSVVPLLWLGCRPMREAMTAQA